MNAVCDGKVVGVDHCLRKFRRVVVERITASGWRFTKKLPFRTHGSREGPIEAYYRYKSGPCSPNSDITLPYLSPIAVPQSLVHRMVVDYCRLYQRVMLFVLPWRSLHRRLPAHGDAPPSAVISSASRGCLGRYRPVFSRPSDRTFRRRPAGP
jgi:hypothetical protein